MSDPKDDKQVNKDKFKDTVFLPKTDFPMRGNLPEKEPAMVKNWQESGLYQKIRETSKDKPKWILHDGPPYANGNIHMGHALNKILKDVINKSWQMMGYNAPYVPGWDCHGLPIEWKVEEKYRADGKDKDEVDPIQFRGECRDFAQEWIDIQSGQFQRLGVIGDWDTPYLTMTKPAEAQIAREIHKFLKNGGLYRGVKPVMWSTVEQTALAEAEVEYHEHKSVTIWVKFPVKETKLDLLKDASVVIWTTTPWTMPSNRAIGFGEDIIYRVLIVDEVEDESKVKVGEKLIVSEKLLGTNPEDSNENLGEAIGGERSPIIKYRLLDRIKGSELAGTICQHPLNGQGYDFDVPLLAGDFVSTDTGTGFVHIAPGHGADDFYLGQKHGIEVTDNVTDDGKFRDHVPLFAGDVIYDQDGKMGNGNFTVIKAIDEAGGLLAKGSLRHEYPHSWRSKAPVIFRTTPQWFIAMDNDIKLRETALKAIKETNWHPAKGEARITAMIENRPDWCISRQRAWGVPIALFVHKDTKEIIKDEAVLNRIADAFEEKGSDAWWSMDPQEFLGNTYSADDYEQVFDIVDVWFESGSTHSFVVDAREDLLKNEKRQSDLYLEGSDQHRGWFHSSLLEASGTKGHAPYKNVLTHGFVLDEKGYKMSKSLGNVVDPLKIMEQSGADILRLWTMTSDYAEDIRIGKDTLKNTGDLYRRIRNTLRFLLGALDGFNKSEQVSLDKVNELPELEQLVLHQLYEIDQKIRGYIQNYEYGKMAKELHEFCNNNLSAFYFDIRKDRLYCDDPNSFERRACRSVMAEIYNCLVTWFAPVLSFTCEEAWSHRPEGVFSDEESIHLREFPEVPESWCNAALAGKWFAIREVRDAVLVALEPHRADKTIGSSLEAAPIIKANADYQKALREIDLAEIAIISHAEIVDGEALEIDFKKAEGEKCVRCWKVLPEVAQSADDLCDRCSNVVHQKQAA
jgi:isoleucyl-tRNA synthetase